MSTIVIISTEEDCLFLISKLLGKSKKICAKGFEEGLKVIEEENPDLVIVDCEIFCKEGVRSLHKLREKFNGYIVIWALSFFIDEHKNKVDNKTFFVNKLTEDLAQKVNELLEERMVIA